MVVKNTEQWIIKKLLRGHVHLKTWITYFEDLGVTKISHLTPDVMCNLERRDKKVYDIISNFLKQKTYMILLNSPDKLTYIAESPTKEKALNFLRCEGLGELSGYCVARKIGTEIILFWDED